MHWLVRGLSCKPNIYVSWSTSELRVRLAPLNRFKPSSKIFFWPFQGGTSFVDLLCLCSVLCLLCLCARLFICAMWSPAGKGLTSWLSFVVSTVSLSLSHWYPGSGMVLDCIDSWSLHPYFQSPLVYIKLVQQSCGKLLAFLRLMLMFCPGAKPKKLTYSPRDTVTSSVSDPEDMVEEGSIADALDYCPWSKEMVGDLQGGTSCKKLLPVVSLYM